MNNRLGIKIVTAIIFVVFILLSVVHAKKNNQTISLRTSLIDLVYAPPIRFGPDSHYQLHIEVPRLNLIINLLENYLQYLLRLEKLAVGTKLHLIYAPDTSFEDGIEVSDVLRMKETGLNSVLSLVNTHLRDKKLADENYLLEGAGALFTIPDKLPRKTGKMIEKLELTNVSSFHSSIEPDTSFAVIDSNRVVTSRSYIRSNRLFLIDYKDSVGSFTMLLGQSQKWYDDLTPSYDGKYLAMTDGSRPSVMEITASASQFLFTEPEKILLNMSWSTKKPWLAGMILDTSSNKREFFVFDASLKTMLIYEDEEIQQQANYLNSSSSWSSDGTKVLMTSARSVHLIDVEANKNYMNLVKVPNEIAEIIWSDDSKSFAFVEIEGQARDRYIFDDLDFRRSILHRFHINSDFSVVEDHAQRVESRNTIKLVSFWTKDRLLFLEGRLLSKRLNTPVWDLSSSFRAFLTPGSSTAAARELDPDFIMHAKVSLPMQYLFVFRNLDSKYKNIYDAGFNHSNVVYEKNFDNIWIMGLRRPDEVKKKTVTYNYRRLPYPFAEKNTFILSDISAVKIETFMKFLQSYELRVVRFDESLKKLFVLANFSGPLNLWSGELYEIINNLTKQGK